MYKNILSFSFFLGLSLFIGSCSNPPETTLDTKTVITNNFKGGSWTKTDDITTHKIIFEPDGIFKKSTLMNFNSFRGYWSVDEPGKVICRYPDGVTMDITVIDEDEFELNDEIYTLIGGYKGPDY
jgi:hypothetical protein